MNDKFSSKVLETWFSPAVLLMSRLTYVSKFAVATALFAVPLILVVINETVEHFHKIELLERKLIAVERLDDIQKVSRHIAVIRNNRARTLIHPEPSIDSDSDKHKTAALEALDVLEGRPSIVRNNLIKLAISNLAMAVVSGRRNGGTEGDSIYSVFASANDLVVQTHRLGVLIVSEAGLLNDDDVLSLNIASFLMTELQLPLESFGKIESFGAYFLEKGYLDSQSVLVFSSIFTQLDASYLVMSQNLSSIFERFKAANQTSVIDISLLEAIFQLQVYSEDVIILDPDLEISDAEYRVECQRLLRSMYHFVTQMAMDFRPEFKKDVVIDLFCYRRRGHNEADEPFGTQPLMYEAIRNQPTSRSIYADVLVEQGVITEQRGQELLEDYRTMLDNGEHVVKSLVSAPDKNMFVDWSPYLGHGWIDNCDTSLDYKELQRLYGKLDELPEGFVLQRQVTKILDDRRKMAAGALPVNWGFAETLAYASLLSEGFPIRLTGQDVGRGTFSHRHAVLHNQKDGTAYVPLKNVAEDDTSFDIYDSLLSEEAVLGFEYGYATTAPKTLVIWEAQFGDFANGAQVVIDQFIASGEIKWTRLCGLTLLLPHGYEGQGPEHSSARLERYLQLCAEHNMQVCVPTTPAQIYHMLRRQAVRPLRKPLVVMTPKSLLRHKLAVSTMEELADGQFEEILTEIDEQVVPDNVRQAIFCSGKVYYELLEYRRANEIYDVAIIRIEQLYPFPEDALLEVLKGYDLEEVVWCQEEPMNQGAWFNSQHHIRHVVAQYKPSLYLRYVGRVRSAAPAAGSMSLHVEQQQALIKDAFGHAES
ncbi:MAG: 2-oxoglutarate dehydrogenase E1 component [Gammaproteobacteria bacterium]|nr:MAG: 2-oxoglutarate dehydrogenase E1 component [Gammaproteobacteria bacterium]